MAKPEEFALHCTCARSAQAHQVHRVSMQTLGNVEPETGGSCPLYLVGPGVSNQETNYTTVLSWRQCAISFVEMK